MLWYARASSGLTRSMASSPVRAHQVGLADHLQIRQAARNLSVRSATYFDRRRLPIATLAFLMSRHCPVGGVSFLHRRARFRCAASHQFFMDSHRGLVDPGRVTVKVM